MENLNKPSEQMYQCPKETCPDFKKGCMRSEKHTRNRECSEHEMVLDHYSLITRLCPACVPVSSASPEFRPKSCYSCIHHVDRDSDMVPVCFCNITHHSISTLAYHIEDDCPLKSCPASKEPAPKYKYASWHGYNKYRTTA